MATNYPYDLLSTSTHQLYLNASGLHIQSTNSHHRSTFSPYITGPIVVNNRSNGPISQPTAGNTITTSLNEMKLHLDPWARHNSHETRYTQDQIVQIKDSTWCSTWYNHDEKGI